MANQYDAPDAEKVVASPPRTLSQYEEPPRPYEVGWAQEQIRRNQAVAEAKVLFPKLCSGSPYDLNHAAEINRTFENRKLYIENKLRRHMP